MQKSKKKKNDQNPNQGRGPAGGANVFRSLIHRVFLPKRDHWDNEGSSGLKVLLFTLFPKKKKGIGNVEKKRVEVNTASLKAQKIQMVRNGAYLHRTPFLRDRKRLGVGDKYVSAFSDNKPNLAKIFGRGNPPYAVNRPRTNSAILWV